MTSTAFLACGATFVAIVLGAGPRFGRSSDGPSWAPFAAAAVAALLVARWLLRAATAEGIALLVILLLAAIPAAALLRRQRRTVAAAEVADRVLETSELLAAELAAGLPPGRALHHAAQGWPLLEPVAAAERLGANVPTAWRAAAEQTVGAEGLRLIAAGWDASARTGGGLAEATERVARSIRVSRASQRMVASELASARATSRLVAVLPIVALLMGTNENSQPIEFLLTQRLGLVCLAGGLAFGLAGLWWIEAIASRVQP